MWRTGLIVALGCVSACTSGRDGSGSPPGASGGISGTAGFGDERAEAGRGAGGSSAGGTASDGHTGGSSPDGTGGAFPSDASIGSGGSTSDAGTAVEPPAGPEGPNAEAFSRITGVLNVDYAGFLGKHDVVYRKPNTTAIQGLTVGNGRTGAIVWSENGLQMQVSGVDTSEQTAFSGGLATLSANPAFDESTGAFEQRLSLYDGTLTTKYEGGATVTILGAPSSEVLGIHVDDPRPTAQQATFELGIWDLSKINNLASAPDLNTWKTLSTFADVSAAGLSRGQTDANHFGYTLVATVEGAAFSTERVGDDRVRLTITEPRGYTIWLACTTRLNAPNHDSLARARATLDEVKRAGYAATSKLYTAFWHDFWRRSFVQYAGASDYLENVYYLATYMIAAGAFGHYPYHFINGVFRATGDDTKWSNAYWYWNQRDVYNSFFASNHADVMHVFNDMYAASAPALRAFTQSRFGISGIWVPETMGFDGNANGTVGSDFTKNIFSTGVEAANNMFLEQEYTGDAAYLRDTAYPFMRDVANFYAGKLSLDASTGQYHMESSNAHETYWNVPNAITDLAAVRSLFPNVIAMSEALGGDATERERWKTILDHLVPYPKDDKNYLPHTPPLTATKNGENVACELIWPYGVTGIGAPDYTTALSTWKSRPFPYGNVWANDAIQAARLGLGDEVLHGLTVMLQKYQSYPNGMTNNTNGVFEYLGVHLSALNEALLQSYDGRIRVFPAMPSDNSYIGRFTLLAVGGFLVSSESEAGEIKYVGLKSTRGGTARLVNPWGMEPIQAKDLGNDAVIVTGSDAELDIPTVAGGIYAVERKTKPLSAYTYARVTGSQNTAPKSLSGTPCTLGR